MSSRSRPLTQDIEGRTARCLRRWQNRTRGRGERLVSYWRPFPLSRTGILTKRSTFTAALAANLQLKDGAVALLQDIKRAGRSIMIVTEGPHDAQETTVSGWGSRLMSICS